MAVALRGTPQTATGLTDTMVINCPAGVVAGDVIVIWCVSRNGFAVYADGFTNQVNSLLNNYEYLGWRTADGTESGFFTINGCSTFGAQAVCAAFSGAAGGPSFWDPSSPLDAATATATSLTPSFLGLENLATKATTNDGDMLLWLLETFQNPAAVTFTYPAGFTGISVTGTSGVLYGSAALAYKVQATHGTTGTVAGTLVGSNLTWAGTLVAIRSGAPNPTVLTVGPVTVEVGSGGSSGAPPIITAPTITGAATLNIGPLTVTAANFAIVGQGHAAFRLGPVRLAVVGARTGPGGFPVPGYRGRWRLTLHTRAFTPKTLAQTIIAELADARGRRLEQNWNQPAALTFTLDGHAPAAALINELLQDVVAWRWDDQTGVDVPVFRGPITQSEDQITEQSHTVTYTCHDYGALLTRRLLTTTYTTTGRDQDLIVGDLLARAVTATTSSGGSLSPASFLPVSLFTANPNGSLRGLSGQNRDRTWYGSQNIGSAVDDLSKIPNGFDYDVIPSAVDDHDNLRVFYPQQGVVRTGIALQYGSTVATVTRTIDSADYANYVRVLGNNQSANPTPQFYQEAAAAGVATAPAGLWMLGDDAADATVSAALLDKALGDLTLNAVLVPHYTLGLTPDAYTWGNPRMGDTVPLIIQSGRLNVNTTVRVLGIAYDIGDDGQEDVALTVSRPRTTFRGLFFGANRDITALNRR